MTHLRTSLPVDSPTHGTHDDSSRAARHRITNIVTIAVSAALLLCACMNPASTADDRRTTEASTNAPQLVTDPERAEFYSQELVWTSCGGATQCAAVEVPLDHDDPGGDRITLAIKRVSASEVGARIGSLVLNFGGPGASGVDLVEGFAATAASPALRARFDLVGFDPRGVGRSAPVDCVDDPDLDALRSAQHERTDTGLERYRAAAADVAAECARRVGPVLGEVDTANTARDLDILRAVLGDERLNYLGYSYGTLLGATYADLFPQRTGRLVLDGALDPTLGWAEFNLAQATEFERSIGTYVDACLAEPGCPLSGDRAAAVGQVEALLDRAVTHPLPTSEDRELTAPLAATGILVALYDASLWPVLTDALAQALEMDDGTTLLFLADAIAGRQPDGTYSSNLIEAQTAITCLDFPMDHDEASMADAAAALDEASPTFGALLGHSEVKCHAWPHGPTREPGPINASGAAPILVLGTTGDPATPYAWSRALADQLDSGHLLTWVGQGHTAYGRANSCLHDAVDAYLLDGTVPAENLRC